jgi:hypothetical protein
MLVIFLGSDETENLVISKKAIDIVVLAEEVFLAYYPVTSGLSTVLPDYCL